MLEQFLGAAHWRDHVRFRGITELGIDGPGLKDEERRSETLDFQYARYGEKLKLSSTAKIYRANSQDVGPVKRQYVTIAEGLLEYELRPDGAPLYYELMRSFSERMAEITESADFQAPLVGMLYLDKAFDLGRMLQKAPDLRLDAISHAPRLTLTGSVELGKLEMVIDPDRDYNLISFELRQKRDPENLLQIPVVDTPCDLWTVVLSDVKLERVEQLWLPTVGRYRSSILLQGKVISTCRWSYQMQAVNVFHNVPKAEAFIPDVPNNAIIGDPDNADRGGLLFRWKYGHLEPAVDDTELKQIDATFGKASSQPSSQP